MNNRQSIGRSFHRHAGEYDRHASVQKRVIGRLFQYLQSHLSAEPTSILDIGCGTGLLLSDLQQRYPYAALTGLDLALNMAVQSRERLGDAVSLVQADAENLPFCSCTFDLLVSTSTLQWLDRLDRFFNECYRVMKPDSLLCIAFFGGTTLWELQECYRHVIERCASGSERLLNRLHTFKDTHEIRQALEQSAFETVLLTSEIETEYYADLPELLRSIKNIGAGSHNKGGGGLGWRRVLNDISALYREKYHTDGGIPASYEVLYITARKRCN